MLLSGGWMTRQLCLTASTLQPASRRQRGGGEYGHNAAAAHGENVELTVIPEHIDV